MNIRQVISAERTDESIFIFARPFILSFLSWLLIGLSLVIIGLVFVFFTVVAFPDLVSSNFQFDVFVLIISAYFLLIIPFITVGFIDYYYDLLVVTDRRILDIDQNSLFSRNISELALEQVEDVSASTSGILRTFFDFGDVTVQSAGAREKFVFKGILHPREVTEIILDLADQGKQRIERGITHLMPSGEVKGVIENRVYTALEPLYRVGALVRHKPSAHSALVSPGLHTRPNAPALPPRSVNGLDDLDNVDDLDIVIDDIDTP